MSRLTAYLCSSRHEPPRSLSGVGDPVRSRRRQGRVRPLACGAPRLGLCLPLDVWRVGAVDPGPAGGRTRLGGGAGVCV